MKVVLFQPRIPQNTGNIVRTCKVTGSDLILVGPLGFSISNRWLKRAGLDYWDGVHVDLIDDLEALLLNTSVPFYFFSSHAKKPYNQVSYTMDSLLIFGSETDGLPPHFREKWPDRFLTIPMVEDSRCLNLSNAVSIVLYGVWEQNQFAGAQQ